jgi:hypothetical protein
MTKIQFEVAAKLSKSEKAAQGKSGFVPIAVRWVIERSNSWVERCKNLVKNFEWILFPCKNKAQSLLHSFDGEAISYLKRCQMGSIRIITKQKYWQEEPLILTHKKEVKLMKL